VDGLALYLILPDRAQPLLGTFVESEETPVVSEHNSPLAAAAAAKSFACRSLENELTLPASLCSCTPLGVLVQNPLGDV
jgi:hypothetical protein